MIKKNIILLLIFLFIFSLLTYVYGMPIDGVLYGILLCLVIIVMYGSYEIYKYNRRKKEIIEIKKNPLLNLEMPRAIYTLEEEYQAFINTLYDEINKANTKHINLLGEMSDFYSLWVHQIKTPISAMSIILQGDNTENGKMLRMELFKIERYTEMVLNFLRLEDISTDLSIEKYNLSSIINQAVKKFAPVFISKNIGIKINDIDIEILTDEKWLVFAIEQIISNSLKYTDKNGEIKIYLKKDTKVLIIEDNGMGIYTEDLPRIFEKGFTGFNGRMDKKATGIGLYLTKKILDKLGNKIEVRSDGVKGTKVLIDLASLDIRHE